MDDEWNGSEWCLMRRTGSWRDGLCLRVFDIDSVL